MTADPEATLRLGWLVDEHWGKAYPIGRRATIGRGPDNTVILRNAEVSRHHAEVRREGGGDRFVLHAMGASGTMLNGAPVVGTPDLKDGDLIEIAFSLLRFQTSPPGPELLVVARDTPAPSDVTDGPTRASMPAAPRRTIFGSRARYWSWLARWFRRPGDAP